MKRLLFRLSALFWLLRLSSMTIFDAWLYSRLFARDQFDGTVDQSAIRSLIEMEMMFWVEP